MNRNKPHFLLPLLCLVLFVVTSATFWPVLQSDFVNFDDPEYVTENELVKKGLTWEGVQWAFKTGHAANWHPVTWLSHMLDATLFGLKPMGHHLTNLLFHCANSVLLLLLLCQITGAMWRSGAVAALFALHPLHVESVAWVAERKDVLSTCFGLLALIAYASYAQSKTARLGSKISFTLALLFLALGLMSKAMLVTWPFVMLLLDIWPLNRANLAAKVFSSESWKLNRKVVLEKLPFFALVVISCVVTFLVQQSGRAVSTTENLPFQDRLENAVASYVKYLGKTIWPVDLAVFYPHPETRYPISEQWPFWVLALVALFLVALSVLTIRRFRNQPYLAIGWFSYLGTLVPVIGIVQVGTQAMADRYTYIPLIGIFVGMVWLFAEVANRTHYGRHLAWGGSLAAAIACVAVTRAQLPHWRDSFSLFQHAVNVTEQNAPALANLGTEYVKRGNNPEAIRLFNAALQADPHFADASYGLGLIAQKSGHLEEAAGHYQNAIQIRPDHALAQHNLGAIFWLQSKRDEAETQFAIALRLKPDFFEAHLNLGSLLLEQGRPHEGQASFRAALEIKPKDVSALLGQALAMKMQGQLSDAEIHLRSILNNNPENPEALLNLGVVLADLGRTNEAGVYFAKVTQLNPQLEGELVIAGQALMARGKGAAAEDRFAGAAYLNPTNVTALENLALLRAQAGKLETAAPLFTRALQLRSSAESYYYLATIHALQGQAANTITNLHLAIRLKPEYLMALNELAWIYATHPKDEFRDGTLAVELAERACRLSGDSEARYWGTLDAAYAEAGRFDEAIKTAEKTITLARTKGQTDLMEKAELRLRNYQQNKAFRQ